MSRSLILLHHPFFFLTGEFCAQNCKGSGCGDHCTSDQCAQNCSAKITHSTVDDGTISCGVAAAGTSAASRCDGHGCGKHCSGDYCAEYASSDFTTVDFATGADPLTTQNVIACYSTWIFHMMAIRPGSFLGQ